MGGTTLRMVGRNVTRMHTDNPEPSTVETAHGDQLPSIHPERYGAFETSRGETVLYDSEADGAWIRADCAVEVER